MNELYDVIIIGAGPAGLTAAIYARRNNLEVCVVGSTIGGTANWAPRVTNFPGFSEISGFNLMNNMENQVRKLGVTIMNRLARHVEMRDNFIVTTDNDTINGRSIILALGNKRRKLGVDGEERLHGKGVSYCATCDGVFFRGEKVIVAGNETHAVQTALMLGEYSDVTVVYKKSLDVGKYWMNKMRDANIKVIEDEVESIVGQDAVSGIKTAKHGVIEAKGIFIENGFVPNCALARLLGVNCTDEGYVIVNPRQETSIEGVFAAGDMCIGSIELKQIVVASAQGAMAAVSAYKYLKR